MKVKKICRDKIAILDTIALAFAKNSNRMVLTTSEIGIDKAILKYLASKGYLEKVSIGAKRKWVDVEPTRRLGWALAARFKSYATEEGVIANEQ
jgi:hypothetical protein